jgi:type VI secretion system protein ImpK
MKALINARKDVPLVDGQSGGSSHSTVPRMRELLRDTALLVTMLSQGGKAESVVLLRARCQQLMSGFSTALEQRGVAADVRDDALYAQCGLLDEVALRALPMDEKPQWDAQPLQVQRFGKHDAGERVFERLAVRMREASPKVDLLECYATVLGLGFMGRYASRGTSFGAREGQEQRTALMASLNAQLEQLRPSVERTFIAERTGTRVADRLYRLSPWVIAGLACAAAALAYLICGHALDAQLAPLAPSLLPSRP